MGLLSAGLLGDVALVATAAGVSKTWVEIKILPVVEVTKVGFMEALVLTIAWVTVAGDVTHVTAMKALVVLVLVAS